jgi:hypothetical protein
MKGLLMGHCVRLESVVGKGAERVGKGGVKTRKGALPVWEGALVRRRAWLCVLV